MFKCQEGKKKNPTLILHIHSKFCSTGHWKTEFTLKKTQTPSSIQLKLAIKYSADNFPWFQTATRVGKSFLYTV